MPESGRVIAKAQSGPISGLIGSGISATWLPRKALIRLLALVLVIAGAKLLGT